MRNIDLSAGLRNVIISLIFCLPTIPAARSKLPATHIAPSDSNSNFDIPFQKRVSNQNAIEKAEIYDEVAEKDFSADQSSDTEEGSKLEVASSAEEEQFMLKDSEISDTEEDDSDFAQGNEDIADPESSSIKDDSAIQTDTMDQGPFLQPWVPEHEKKHVKLQIRLKLGTHRIPALEYAVPKWWFQQLQQERLEGADGTGDKSLRMRGGSLALRPEINSVEGLRNEYQKLPGAPGMTSPRKKNVDEFKRIAEASPTQKKVMKPSSPHKSPSPGKATTKSMVKTTKKVTVKSLVKMSTPHEINKRCVDPHYFGDKLPPRFYSSPIARFPLPAYANWVSSDPFVFQSNTGSTDPSDDYYLQIGFGPERLITGWKVTGSGRKGHSGAVAAYTVKIYRTDRKKWSIITGPEGQPRVFSGSPTDNPEDTGRAHVVTIPPVATAGIRFFPLQWAGKPYFKADVEGCLATPIDQAQKVTKKGGSAVAHHSSQRTGFAAKPRAPSPSKPPSALSSANEKSHGKSAKLPPKDSKISGHRGSGILRAPESAMRQIPHAETPPPVPKSLKRFSSEKPAKTLKKTGIDHEPKSAHNSNSHKSQLPQKFPVTTPKNPHQKKKIRNLSLLKHGIHKKLTPKPHTAPVPGREKDQENVRVQEHPHKFPDQEKHHKSIESVKHGDEMVAKKGKSGMDEMVSAKKHPAHNHHHKGEKSGTTHLKDNSEKEFKEAKTPKEPKSEMVPTVEKVPGGPPPVVCNRIPPREIQFFEMDFDKRVTDLGAHPDLSSDGYVDLRLLAEENQQQNKNNHIALEIDFGRSRELQQLLFKAVVFATRPHLPLINGGDKTLQTQILSSCEIIALGAIRENLPAMLRAFYLQFYEIKTSSWEWLNQEGKPKPLILTKQANLNKKEVQTIFPVRLSDSIRTDKIRIYPELWQNLPLIRIGVIACG